MNLVFLTAIKSDDKFFVNRHSDYSWTYYSRRTWGYWCKKNNCDFYIMEEPIESDILLHRPNFQRWWKIIEMLNKYDQILSVDASIMVRWDAPNFFDMTDNKFTALKSRENMKWTWESANGYKPLFDNYDFDVKKYFNSGFVILNKKHKNVLEKFKKFYYDNHGEIIKYQTEIVKRGTDQPILNYFIQMNNIEINLDFSIKYGCNHLWRWQVLGGNWQLQQIEPNNVEHRIPFFLKYICVWIFSGFPDRGETRNRLMSDVWNAIKNNYK